MANTVSALKRVRVTEHRTEVNRMRKSRLRHALRAMRRLLNDKKVDDAQKIVSKTFSAVDKAAKTGIIKKNTASRYKSRITLRIRSIASQATA